MEPNYERAAHPAEVPPQLEAKSGSRLISRVLPPAVRLWIHSQLDHIETLAFKLHGSDRQILSGYVPEVALSATQAVYRGLHLSQVQVVATDIKINLGQVVRGKPLQLLQPFPVMGQVTLREADLRASLQTALLADAIQDLVQQLFAAAAVPASLAGSQAPVTVPVDVQVGDNLLTLHLAPVTGATTTMTLTTGLTVRDGRYLCLAAPRLSMPTAPEPSPPQQLDSFEIDLGPEVMVKHLAIRDNGIDLEGLVRVIPA